MDHLGGLLPVLERLEVGQLWMSRWPKPSERPSDVGTKWTQSWNGFGCGPMNLGTTNLALIPDCKNDNECGLVLNRT